MSENISRLTGRKGLDKTLFGELNLAGAESGTPSPEALRSLASEFLVGESTVLGAVTFYDFLKPENRGKRAYVCNGTACHAAGTDKKIQNLLAKHLAPEEIGHVCCLGRCHEVGSFTLDGKNYSGKTEDEIHALLKGDTKASQDDYQVSASGIEILTAPYPGLEQHYASFKKLLTTDGEKLLEEIKNAGLRGRGGAGFPISFKLSSCRTEESDTKFIVCNADEGDPGAYSDRYLLEQRPHSVLFGMLVAGYLSKANWGVLYIRAEYPDAIRITQDAVQELRDAGLIGTNIQDSNFNFDFKIISAAGAYICGEETALLNSIEGQRPEVRVRPPFPTQQGLFSLPTVVNNVETLAALHYITSNSGDAYKTIGTEKSTGTKLVCLDSFFNNPGLYEVEMGTPLKTVIYDLGGGFHTPVKALQIGGPLGGLVPLHKIDTLNLDFESFAEAGFLLGHASVVSVPQSFPMIALLEHLFDFAARESCGKCFPCRLGTKRGHELVLKARDGRKIDTQLFNDLLDTLTQGSLCAHGGGIPLPVRNALTYFEDELSEYFSSSMKESV